VCRRPSQTSWRRNFLRRPSSTSSGDSASAVITGIDAFIPGGGQHYHAVEFRQALTTITSSTLALFEGLIAHSSGPEVVGDAARAFVKRVGTPGGAAVSQRVLR
jgi:hypothetical protein